VESWSKRLFKISVGWHFFAMGLTLRRGQGGRFVRVERVEDSATLVPTAIDSE